MPTKISAAAPCLTQPELEKNFFSDRHFCLRKTAKKFHLDKKSKQGAAPVSFLKRKYLPYSEHLSPLAALKLLTSSSSSLMQLSSCLTPFKAQHRTSINTMLRISKILQNPSHSWLEQDWPKTQATKQNRPTENKHKTTPTVGQSKTSCYLRLWLERWSSPYWECQQWWHNSSSPSSPLVAL